MIRTKTILNVKVCHRDTLFFLKTVDISKNIGYNNNGDKRRLIVWKLYVSVKRGSPYRISGSFKSSSPYCEWEF